MNKIRKNEQGFSALELILVILIIGILCVAGYFVYKNHKNTKTSSSVAPYITKTASTNNSTLGWKTFNWTYEGLSIKYPPTWNFENPNNSPNPDYANSPEVFIKSNKQQTVNGYVASFDGGKTEAYNGAFDIELSVNSLSNNICNVADNTDSSANDSNRIVKITPTVVPNYKSMNIIEDGGTDMNSASEIVITDATVKLGITTPPYLQDVYQSKAHAGQYVCISSGFFGENQSGPGNFNYVTIPLKTFENMPDYNNGLNAIKSVAY